MAVRAKMKLDEKVIHAGSTRPQAHFEESHGYDCNCDWIPGESTQVQLSVVTRGDGKENSDYAAATPVGDMTLVIDNPKAADYFSFDNEYYVEIRKARG